MDVKSRWTRWASRARRFSITAGLSIFCLPVSLTGGFYDVDLHFDRVLDFKVTSQPLGHNQVVLRVSAEGAGRHTLTLRSDNLTFNEPGKQEMDLISGVVREAVWHAHVVSPKTPWVAVVIPDGTLSRRREVTGSENPQVLAGHH